MRVLSVFAGIEGFGLGFERAGMTIAGQIEWDKNCQKVLERHYPGKLVGEDICDVSGSEVRAQLGVIDLMCGGFPCQDISIAGPQGLGLAGSRSGEFFSFTRLVGEYHSLVESLYPRYVAIENTDALLTSPRQKKGEVRPPSGSDMACVIEGLVDLGYGVAWRVVDGRHFGSPQRRSRLLIVGHLGGDPGPAWQVLGDPEPGSGPAGESAERRYKRGPKAVVGPSQSGSSEVLTFRKSANPRKSLAEGGYQTWVPEDGYNTLTGFDYGGATRQRHLVIQNGRVRANTLTEWERLMTFPDGWTAGVPDSARGHMLGNAFMPVKATWFGRRFMRVNAALPVLAGLPAKIRRLASA